MTISERCVNKPTTTFLVFLMSVLLGIYCVFKLPVDMYPDMDLPYMIVITTYSGAGPEEVEQSVTRTMESSLSGLSGLKKLQSRSMTGTSLIILEMNYGTNLDATTNEIRDKIDLIRRYLPSDADAPITIKMDPSDLLTRHGHARTLSARSTIRMLNPVQLRPNLRPVTPHCLQ